MSYDTKLRAWVADLGIMHAKLMVKIAMDLDNAKAMGLETGPLEKQLNDYEMFRVEILTF